MFGSASLFFESQSERRDKKTENLKRQSSHGILLYGPPGVGKTTICKTLVQQVQRDGNVQIDWISATSPLQIKNMAFDCVSTPTLRIIDSGHLLAMGQGEHALSTLAMSLERAYEENEPVVTIVVLTWPDTFDKNPSVSSPWASLCQTTRLGHIVQMERPSYNQRHQILLSSFQSDFALLRKEDGKETEREEGTLKWIPQLASRTAGFCARDLIQLVQTTVGLAHASNTEESISQHSHMMPNVVQFALQKCLTNQSSLSIETEIPAITWDDVSGVAQVRQRLEEHLLWPLLHPEQLERLGLDSGTSGVLLHGKGGTGKTLCAHAFLNSISSHMNVISVKASHLFSKYLGESEAAVRRLFSRARSMAPCILFFDEFDSIGARRSGGGYGGGSENEDSGGVRGRVVSQLLNEMDGVSFRVGEEKKRGVRREQIFLLGSTSRLEAVDDAFVRPGRFGTVINMPPLSLSDRVEALLIHSRDMKFADDVDLNAIALLTPNWTGSNLAMLCRNASLCALRQDLETEFVSSQHFFSAMNTIH